MKFERLLAGNEAIFEMDDNENITLTIGEETQTVFQVGTDGTVVLNEPIIIPYQEPSESHNTHESNGSY